MDEPEWTLEDHLLNGRSAIRELASATAETISAPRVCFHLYPLSPEDDEKWGMEAHYCRRAKREFEDRGQDFAVHYVGGCCGIEAWQDIQPTDAWLAETLPRVWDIAAKAGLFFAGWSFEPCSGPYISVSPMVNVYSGNDLGDLPSPEASRAVGRFSDWLRRQLGRRQVR